MRAATNTQLRIEIVDASQPSLRSRETAHKDIASNGGNLPLSPYDTLASESPVLEGNHQIKGTL